MKQYLPIGSIVRLKEGSKRLMIYGRKQKQVATGTEYDYVGCLYPEGNISEEHTYLFNQDMIEQVFFIGFQDAEEFVFATGPLQGNPTALADA
jgi:hypothetical protein